MQSVWVAAAVAKVNKTRLARRHSTRGLSNRAHWRFSKSQQSPSSCCARARQCRGGLGWVRKQQAEPSLLFHQHDVASRPVPQGDMIYRAGSCCLVLHRARAGTPTRAPSSTPSAPFLVPLVHAVWHCSVFPMPAHTSHSRAPFESLGKLKSFFSNIPKSTVSFRPFRT